MNTTNQWGGRMSESDIPKWNQITYSAFKAMRPFIKKVNDNKIWHWEKAVITKNNLWFKNIDNVI